MEKTKLRYNQAKIDFSYPVFPTKTSNYYKCKSCMSGFGRLTGVFFGIGYLKKESVGNKIGLVAFLYMLLFVLPTMLLSASFLKSVSYLKVLVLASLLAVTVYSLATWSKRSTANKKSRFGTSFKR